MYPNTVSVVEADAYDVRLSMLRSPTSPDLQADQGEHHFSFAIIPHRGQLAESNVSVEATKFNNEVYCE